MNSKKNMDDFLEQFMIMQNNSDKWFSSSIKREIGFFLDYFVNLNEHCRNSADEEIQEVGVIIRNDFIDIAVRLEDCAHNFLTKICSG